VLAAKSRVLPRAAFRRILCAMSINVLPPTSDFVFKLLFGDERNKSMLIGLLRALVDLPSEECELTFLDTHLKREFKGDKLGILDVRVRTTSGQIINIEIQVEPQDFIAKRISYYKSKMITGQLGKSDEYEKIQRVVCVCITSKPLFPEVPEYLNRFRFCNLTNGLCFEGIPEEIYTVELLKVPSENDGTGWWEWVRFLLARTEEDVEMVAQANTEIRKAADALYVLSADPNVRTEYERHEMAVRDEISRLASAKAQVDRKWQGVVADMGAKLADRDAKLADRDAKLADRNTKLADMGTKLADKDTVIADRDAKLADRDAKLADKDAKLADTAAENERLRAQLAEFQARQGN